MKKHLFGKIACLFMSAAMAFGLTACAPETTGGDNSNTDGGDPITCTVTFDMQSHGGTAPQSQTVNKGGHATKPTPDPTDADYDFGGWYKEAATTNEFNFETETIEKDTTVYAKWTAKSAATYTVSFDLNGHGGTAPQSQTVNKGGHATKPTPDPTDADYNFVDWYKEAAGTNVFNFATETIESNTTVYAKWTPKQAGTDPSKDTSSPLDSNATIYVVGDSTACDYSAKLDVAYLPRYGFGTQLANYINCNPSQIKNLALSGRSSLSFLTEDNYKTVLKPNIKEGDYLIIAFGHNDEKVGEEERYTDPTGSHTEATKNGSPSFQYVLYENYVKLATDAKATPILCTPIVRYDSTGSYTGSKVHDTSTGNYSAAVRTLAAATQTALVDLTEITKAIYKADNTEAQYFHSHSSYLGEKEEDKPTGRDDTHLNMYGAKVVAYALLKNLPDGCTLKDNVITNAAAPTHEADYASAIRADYVRPDYTAPTLGTPIATTTGDVKWYASAFGDLGTNNSSKFEMTYEDGVFTVGSAKDGEKTYGKITKDGDGIVAVFVQIPVNKNFTISARVKLTATEGANNQSGFGIMLRDDMYVTSNFKNLKSNFAAVGALNATSATAIFTRESENLASETEMTTTINTTATYQLSLTRSGQNTIVYFGDDTNQYSQSYKDFKMNLVDSEYMYLCLFANRGLVAQFSNVNFMILGDNTQEA